MNPPDPPQRLNARDLAHVAQFCLDEYMTFAIAGTEADTKPYTLRLAALRAAAGHLGQLIKFCAAFGIPLHPAAPADQRDLVEEARIALGDPPGDPLADPFGDPDEEAIDDAA